MTEQDTGKYRQNTKDQYFTREHIAKKCVGHIYSMYDNLDTYEWIEPSAGNGVFLRALPDSAYAMGIDIDPQGNNILNLCTFKTPIYNLKTHHRSIADATHLMVSFFRYNGVFISDKGARSAPTVARKAGLVTVTSHIQRCRPSWCIAACGGSGGSAFKMCEGVKSDYLKWKPSTDVKKRIVFGNPPFGRQSSLAKAFIKHSAKHADIIAFILPKSFVKPSMFNAFPMNYHCILSDDIEHNAFEVNGKLHNVPCVFQIWEKKEYNRIVEAPTKEIGFTYVKYGAQFDIVCKRVGGLAGKCFGWRSTAAADFHKEYHYFIKLDEKYLQYTGEIIDKINMHTFPSNTVGPRSLSKSEINVVLNQILESYF